MEEKNKSTDSGTEEFDSSYNSSEDIEYNSYSNEELDYSTDNENKVKVLINETKSSSYEYTSNSDKSESEEEIEINEVNFEVNELKNKIVKIERQNNINILYIDKNLNTIYESELLKLIDKDYDIKEQKGKGGQAVVKDIGKNLVARFSTFEQSIITNEVIEYLQKYKQKEYKEICNISNEEIIEYIKENNKKEYDNMFNISNNKIIEYIKKNNFERYKEIENKVKQTQKKLQDFIKETVKTNIVKNIPAEELKEYKNNYVKEKYSKTLENYKENLFMKNLKKFILSDENLKDYKTYYKTYVIKEKLDKYIKDNNEILSHLKGIKSGSTIPINSFIIVCKDGYKTIEISKLREKGDLRDAKEDEEHKNLSSISRIEQLIKIFKNEHTAGIIHRDIKAGNTLVDKNDKLTATDYGLANIVGKEIPKYHGTPAYIAPEVFKEELETKDITQKIDVYSLGVMFFEELLECCNIYEFIKKEYKQFCNNEKDENKRNCRGFFSEYSKKITKDIKKDIIYLNNFLPKEVINNVNNASKINKLKEKLVVFLKHMLIANPKKRATIFEVEKEFDEIISFILENLKKVGKDGIKTTLTREDLLFLDKSKLQQQTKNPKEEQKEQEEIINKKLYDLKEFNEGTIKTASNKLKKSLEKLLKTKEDKKQYKNGVLFNRNNGETEKELDNALDNLKLKKSFSQNTIDCLTILKECFVGVNNIKLPDKLFYDKMDDLKNNTEEYLTVMNKLIQLRELILAIEIQKLEQIESSLEEKNLELKKEIKKLREVRDDVNLATRIYNNKEIAKSLFVKDEKSEEFKNLFKKFQQEDLELRNMDEKLIESNINIICSKQKGYSELIRILFNKIPMDKQDIIYDKLFNKAVENNSINVLISLINRDVVKLDDKKINDCIKVICSNNGYLELMNTIIDKIKDDEELFSIFINNIFTNIQNNNDMINNLLINNINKFITIFNNKQNFDISLFAPFELICINENNRYSELIENFINNIINNENCINMFNMACKNDSINIIDKLFANESSKIIIVNNITKNKDYFDIVKYIFDLSYKNDCSNTINTLFKIEKGMKNIDSVELLYKAISDGKIKIAKELINLNIKFNKENIEKLAKKNDELFTLFKQNLAKMANMNNEKYQEIKNIKIIKKKDAFNKIKYSINENDFKKLENALNLIAMQNVGELSI